MNPDQKHLYTTDYYGWKEQQKQLLINRQLDQLDFDNLINELDDMSSELDTLESRLTTLLLHLLKYQYQVQVINPDLNIPYNCRNWKGTIREQRKKLTRLISKHPHLKHLIPEVFEQAYLDGKELAIKAMNDYVLKHQQLDDSSYPAQCPWTFNQIITEDWLPED